MFAKGAWWLIGLGVVGALVAATFGFLDLVAIPMGTKAFRTGLLHMALNLVVVCAFGGSFLLRQARLEEPNGVASWLIALSAVALALLAAAGWLGGRLAYRYGVRVADDRRLDVSVVGVLDRPENAVGDAERPDRLHLVRRQRE